MCVLPVREEGVMRWLRGSAGGSIGGAGALPATSLIMDKE